MLGFGSVRADNAFPTEPGEFEVYQERELKAGDCEITRHLGNVSLGEVGHYLRIYDY